MAKVVALGTTIIRRPHQNAVRAQRAAERKAFEESFSYEDDLKRDAAREAERAESTAAETPKTGAKQRR